MHNAALLSLCLCECDIIQKDIYAFKSSSTISRCWMQVVAGDNATN